jgi:hypothetical protein
MRGVVWGGDDLADLVVLAKGPSGSLLAQDQSDAAREERKKVVQAARTAIMNSETAGHGSVVGFVSPPTTESLTSEALAFDVASSIGAVGRKVMVIDLAFSDQARETTAKHAEVDEALRLLFASGDSDLATIRSLATDVIAHAQGLTPSVAALVAESGTVDPSDILAGRPLGELVDQASLLYDFVLVVQPPRNLVPGSDSLHLLVQQQVLVATRGRTTVAELTSEVGANASGRPRILGVVLLTKSGLFRRLAGFRKSDPPLLERRIDPATNGAAWSTGATNSQGSLDGKHVSHPELSEAGESDLDVRQPVQSSISQSDSQ